MLVRHVDSALRQIASEGLHGSEQRPPKGFRRGIDVFGPDLRDRVIKSSSAYRARHGRAPDLITPKSFTEKQVLFKFYAPVPVSPPPSDKLRSCAYVPEAVRGKVRVPRRLFVSGKAELPGNDALAPGSYFLKSNHGSGTNFRIQYPLGDEKRARFEATARRWLSLAHANSLSLWWNEAVQRNLYIEEDLGSIDADAPDWKFFVFNGRVEIFQVDVDRAGDHVQTIYDRAGNFLKQELYFKSGSPVEMPADLETMIEVAEAIGRHFDFVRVDMFRKDGAIYLGEIGLVMNGATLRIRSPELDDRLGGAWQAPWIGQVAANFSDGHYHAVQAGSWDWGGRHPPAAPT